MRPSLYAHPVANTRKAELPPAADPPLQRTSTVAVKTQANAGEGTNSREAKSRPAPHRKPDPPPAEASAPTDPALPRARPSIADMMACRLGDADDLISQMKAKSFASSSRRTRDVPTASPAASVPRSDSRTRERPRTQVKHYGSRRRDEPSDGTGAVGSAISDTLAGLSRQMESFKGSLKGQAEKEERGAPLHVATAKRLKVGKLTCSSCSAVRLHSEVMTYDVQHPVQKKVHMVMYYKDMRECVLKTNLFSFRLTKYLENFTHDYSPDDPEHRLIVWFDNPKDIEMIRQYVLPAVHNS